MEDQADGLAGKSDVRVGNDGSGTVSEGDSVSLNLCVHGRCRDCQEAKEIEEPDEHLAQPTLRQGQSTPLFAVMMVPRWCHGVLYAGRHRRRDSIQLFVTRYIF